MSQILTHERINSNQASGLLGILAPAKGILWGGNALQSISIGRHTPRNIVQAIGYLGIVDYTSGVITSDAQLDTILVESCSKADASGKKNSIYKYAALQTTVGQESYVMTSFGATFGAGSPAMCNFGWLTSGLATYLDTQAAPTPGTGEESAFAVVLGDDGSGITLVSQFNSGVTPTVTSNLPILDVNGNLQDISDQGLPAGVQNVSFTGTINRDQILDVRTTSPVQWVTTYPVDLRANMEIHVLPTTTGVEPGDVGYNPSTFRHLVGSLANLSVVATNLGKHLSASAGAGLVANPGDIYIEAIGLTKTGETEGVSVGRYLTYGFEFLIADLLLPLPQLS